MANPVIIVIVVLDLWIYCAYMLKLIQLNSFKISTLIFINSTSVKLWKRKEGVLYNTLLLASCSLVWRQNVHTLTSETREMYGTG